MLQVTYSKLLRYTQENRFFQLVRRGAHIDLIFVPGFPEAEDHSGGESVRILMRGELKKDKFVVETVEVETDGRVAKKDMNEADSTYAGWLQFIEDSY